MIYRLLILFALVLAGIAVWLTLAPRQTGPALMQAARPVGPDQGYAATDATVVETGPDGRPMYTLQARQVQQDPLSDTIDLTTVRMAFNDSSGGRWQAHSDKATAQQGSAIIDLAGAVDVSGTFAGSDQPVTIRTDRLHVDTRSQVIRTRTSPTLSWAGYVVTARGLLVDIKNHNIKLESEVHGHSIP